MASVDLIGSSTKLRAVLENIDMIAPVDSAVLIQGETGTGKEVIARAIHNASPRHKSRFVALNCAAIPADLLESELFGHERGAFTGAVAQTQGRFQSADSGTLFLDEIGDLPLELQPKLLRVLQEGEVQRLGGSRAIRIDARVIAATNQNLWQMVQEKKFRADLYYRLNVFPLFLPPLRERAEDIPLLVRHFVHKFADQQGKTINTIPAAVMASLEQYYWPGNIRELQNIIERGVIMTTGPALSPRTTEALKHELPPLPPLPAGGESLRITTLAEAERAHINAILHETDGIVAGPHGAAAKLGLPRTTLLSKMQRLGISGGRPRSRAAQSLGEFVRIIGGGCSHWTDQPGDLRVVAA